MKNGRQVLLTCRPFDEALNALKKTKNSEFYQTATLQPKPEV